MASGDAVDYAFENGRGGGGAGAGVASRSPVTAWGAAARKRRAVMLRAWEEEQARLAEERDLDGIDADLLED